MPPSYNKMKSTQDVYVLRLNQDGGQNIQGINFGSKC